MIFEHYMKQSLMHDDYKTEFLLVGTRKQLAKLPIDGVIDGDSNVSPSPSIRNLSVWLDPYLNLNGNITRSCKSAFYYLYNIRHIWRYLLEAAP